MNSSLPANRPRTLLEMAGALLDPPRLADSTLLIVDAQREYLDGHLPLAGIEASLDEASQLLQRARAAGTPVVHVVHRGQGPLFNPQAAGFDIVAPLRPAAEEAVVEKLQVNAFVGTDLQERLLATGRRSLIIIGYMTHNCVDSAARAAVDLGYRVTIVAAACATRDLPDLHGGAIGAEVIHAATLAGLSDCLVTVVARASEIPA